MNNACRYFMVILPVFIGVSGAFSVLFGAWLAHASSSYSLNDVERMTTAHFYQFIHTAILLVLWLAFEHKARNVIAISALLMVNGILLFSGSLYIKTLFSYSEISALAPFGGMSFAIGWGVLLFLGKRK